MEPERGLIAYEEPAPESTDLLSSAWCSSAIQVLHTGPKECSMALVEHPVMALGNDRNDMLAKSDRSLVVDNSSFSTTQWKYDDLKSWIWLQKAIHPELDYDLCLKKKWLPRKMPPWNGISLKKWVKERKQKRKEEARLQRAEVHAAVSVAGVAAALAAIAVGNAAQPRSPGMRETAVASAAALVAAQCAKVAEAAGASRDQVAAAVDAARASTDASSVITLTAAAATSLRGAATLRGRRSASGGGHVQNGVKCSGGPGTWQRVSFTSPNSENAHLRTPCRILACPTSKQAEPRPACRRGCPRWPRAGPKPNRNQLLPVASWLRLASYGSLEPAARYVEAGAEGKDPIGEPREQGGMLQCRTPPPPWPTALREHDLLVCGCAALNPSGRRRAGDVPTPRPRARRSSSPRRPRFGSGLLLVLEP